MLSGLRLSGRFGRSGASEARTLNDSNRGIAIVGSEDGYFRIGSAVDRQFKEVGLYYGCHFLPPRSTPKNP